jgi:uncharacterized protein YdhG (YjbR/CyaY superfamily)
MQRLEDTNRRIDQTSKRIDELKEDTQRQYEDLKTFMLWGFGILFGGMGILIGFVLWDRRTALEPFVKKTRDLKLAKTLKEEGLL